MNIFSAPPPKRKVGPLRTAPVSPSARPHIHGLHMGVRLSVFVQTGALGFITYKYSKNKNIKKLSIMVFRD